MWRKGSQALDPLLRREIVAGGRAAAAQGSAIGAEGRRSQITVLCSVTFNCSIRSLCRRWKMMTGKRGTQTLRPTS